MGCVMIAGFACALALIALFGLQRSAILKPGFDPEVVRNLFVFGFFVGALLIRDVRAGAHAQLLQVRSLRDPSEPASQLTPPSALSAEVAQRVRGFAGRSLPRFAWGPLASL